MDKLCDRGFVASLILPKMREFARSRTMKSPGARTLRTLLGERGFRAAIAWLAFGLVMAVTSQAEVTWLQPERASATPGAVMAMSVLSADQFGASDPHVPPGHIASIEAQTGGQPVTTGPLGVTDNLAKFTTTFVRPGIGLVLVDYRPEARSISRGEIERYLRSVFATDEVRTAWNEIGAPNPWQEVRTIRLKAFVRIGQPASSDQAWRAPAREGLDVVPEVDPTGLHLNDPLRVRITRDGRPLTGVVVEYVSTGEARQHIVMTDENGQVVAPVDARGDWLIRCFDVRRVTADNHDWEVAITAATLTVQ